MVYHNFKEMVIKLMEWVAGPSTTWPVGLNGFVEIGIILLGLLVVFTIIFLPIVIAMKLCGR